MANITRTSILAHFQFSLLVTSTKQPDPELPPKLKIPYQHPSWRILNMSKLMTLTQDDTQDKYRHCVYQLESEGQDREIFAIVNQQNFCFMFTYYGFQDIILLLHCIHFLHKILTIISKSRFVSCTGLSNYTSLKFTWCNNMEDTSTQQQFQYHEHESCKIEPMFPRDKAAHPHWLKVIVSNFYYIIRL